MALRSLLHWFMAAVRNAKAWFVKKVVSLKGIVLINNKAALKRGGLIVKGLSGYQYTENSYIRAEFPSLWSGFVTLSFT